MEGIDLGALSASTASLSAWVESFAAKHSNAVATHEDESIGKAKPVEQLAAWPNRKGKPAKILAKEVQPMGGDGTQLEEAWFAKNVQPAIANIASAILEGPDKPEVKVAKKRRQRQHK